MYPKSDVATPAWRPEIKAAPELENLCGERAAIDFAKTACASAVFLNSCTMNYLRHVCWFPFGLEYWFEGQNQAFATWMDLGTHWLNLMSPGAETAPAETTSGICKEQPVPEPKIPEVAATPAEEIEREIEEQIEREIEETKMEREIEEQRLEREIEEMEHGIDVAVEAFEEGILA